MYICIETERDIEREREREIRVYIYICIYILYIYIYICALESALGPAPVAGVAPHVSSGVRAAEAEGRHAL